MYPGVVSITVCGTIRTQPMMTMDKIAFSAEQKDRMVGKVKAYVNEELQQDIGSFEAEFLIDFFARELGAYFYNRGLHDAQQVFNEKAEDIGYLIQELEQTET